MSEARRAYWRTALDRPAAPSWITSALLATNSSTWRRYYWTAKHLNVRPGDDVLAWGCGSGSSVSLCLARGAHSVVGCDNSWLQLLLAYRRNRGAFLLGRLELHRAKPGVLRMPKESFDKILCVDVLDRCEDKNGALRELASLIRSGGMAGITTGVLSSRQLALVAGEDIRLRMIATGWIEIHVEHLPLRRGFSACLIGRKLPLQQRGDAVRRSLSHK